MNASIVNVPMLKGKMVERGTNVESLAVGLGMDKGTLYKRMKDGNFSLKEALAIKDLLNLTDQEAIRIFFGFEVA